ncbi:glycosyltransferase family 4 protein [Novosphingobium sp. FKTRR1]|uniref:glycosyltransferase family 4 protein n=1 Tax=Novosphingobium sp. FKTRR1 TaxID=2879118 RepID=UPI001CEFE81A|nr:glycosyltransferase family 4 protein [Novosphingobium sp. FKTRR1]
MPAPAPAAVASRLTGLPCKPQSVGSIAPAPALADEATARSSLFARPAASADPHPLRVALVGTYAPLKCGIATFTADVRTQLARYHPEVTVDVHALAQPGSSIAYPGATGIVAGREPADYALAARRINESCADVVWIQHEFGIFGGPDGAYVCDLVEQIMAPVVLSLHTVLAAPAPEQEHILRFLIGRASAIMVMSQHGRDLLVTRYGADPATVRVIAHGAPDRPFGREDMFKARLGLAGRDVITTFGLIGPGKGLERMIEALPAIVERHPQVLYRIIGATHPNLVAHQGEAYREGIEALAQRLGVEDHIAWDNRFLDTDDLLDQLEATEIYVTPYPNLQQSTSGTLSYAVALGKAVVSTPYLHARELLADGAGVLVEPDSSEDLARAINALLDDRALLMETRRRAYAVGRRTIWPEFAHASADLVRSVVPPMEKSAPLPMSDLRAAAGHGLARRAIATKAPRFATKPAPTGAFRGDHSPANKPLSPNLLSNRVADG